MTARNSNTPPPNLRSILTTTEGRRLEEGCRRLASGATPAPWAGRDGFVLLSAVVSWRHAGVRE